MGIKAEPGDWFAGFEPVVRGNKLVFAMKVAETLSFEEYFRDNRFAKKIPDISGNWKQICGDNMYYLDDQGKYQQVTSVYHVNDSNIRQDLKHPYVFISKHFFYFGGNAIEIPTKFNSIRWSRQGCKCSHDIKLVTSFLRWLRKNYETGAQGNPAHAYRIGSCN